MAAPLSLRDLVPDRAVEETPDGLHGLKESRHAQVVELYRHRLPLSLNRLPLVPANLRCRGGQRLVGGRSQLIKNVRDISATVNYADDLDDTGTLTIENQIVIVREQP